MTSDRLLTEYDGVMGYLFQLRICYGCTSCLS